MAVSVIISNLNGARFLPKLLDSLRAQQGVETEVIVVDRLSHDESRSILAGYPEVRVVEERPETGLVAGYHVGAGVATKEHLYFCNEDMWFEPDCLARLEARIDLPNRVAAADPWQWSYDGERWIHGGVRFVRRGWDPNSPYPLRGQLPTCDLAPGALTAFPCAGAFLIHRRVYDEVGGWDTSFFLDFEDVDLAIRMWQRDWYSVTVPDAKVYHAVGMSNAQVIVTTKQKVNGRRYVSGRSSLFVMALKYFTGPAVLWGGAMLAVTCLSNLVRLKRDRIGHDRATVREIRRRAGAALAYRKANAAVNRARPGQRFFTDPAFADGPGASAGSPPEPSAAAPVRA